jgi:hydroxyacylglutathione hydrolase
MLNIIPIPAFQDNYIWLIENGTHATVVDPGDAAPVIAALKQHGLKLSTILITHHHADHIGGVDALMAEFAPQVFAPQKEQYAFKHTPVHDNQTIHIQDLDLSLKVIDVGGHTLGHVAYYGANLLFCGDTLFGCGCGRLFEGTPAQMFNSLQKIAALPENTAVYCAHEYTEHNLQFAQLVEANNAALKDRTQMTKALRSSGQPSLPSNITLELATNPFLRCRSPEIMAYLNLPQGDPIAVFTALRAMRNQF